MRQIIRFIYGMRCPILIAVMMRFRAAVLCGIGARIYPLAGMRMFDMKKICMCALLSIAISGIVPVAAQQKKPVKTAPPPTKNAAVKEESAVVKDEVKVAKAGDGFKNIAWGAPLSSVRGGILGKMVYTDEKKVIVSRDGDIEYLYGFLYRDPAITGPAGGEKEAKADASAVEGRLFFVAIRFPYLGLNEVRKKIQDTYGPPTGETIKDNQGALVWDSEKTTIILWVDRYEKKPFSRKITYVSKQMIRELENYRNEIFNSAEMEIIRKLAP